MKMLHVTIQTNHFENEIQFFQNHAGLNIVQDMREFGKNMVFLANGMDETRIEIIEKPEATSSGNENLSIGFHAENVEQKRESLIAEGYEVTPILSPVPNVKFFFVKDPAGVMIQFM